MPVDKTAVGLVEMSAWQEIIRNRLHRCKGSSALELTTRLGEVYWMLKTRFYFRYFFGQIEQSSRILRPMRLTNVRNIFVGRGVRINKYAFLLTVQLPGRPKPRLVIEDGCIIGHMNHITSVDEVIIGRDVLTADRVHISDNTHVFTDPDIPIRRQGVTSKGRVSIGEGSWIGENASVLSCKIGKHCVIGANAVVISDIPDFSVAVGAPARVVRQFDPSASSWKRITHDRVLS